MASGRGILRKRPPGRKSEAALDWRPLSYRVKLAVRLMAHRIISLLRSSCMLEEQSGISFATSCADMDAFGAQDERTDEADGEVVWCARAAD